MQNRVADERGIHPWPSAHARAHGVGTTAETKQICHVFVSTGIDLWEKAVPIA